MRTILAEQTILFVSVIKWTVLATLAGAAIGVSSVVFIKILNWSIAAAGKYPYYFAALPLAMLASRYVVKFFAPDAEGHGTEKIIKAVHERSGKIRFAVVPVKLLATIITIAAGGSAGKEGPAAQIGAAISSKFADLMRFGDNDRKRLVICGISAGFAAIFGTPISGAIFGVEVLFAGVILYDVLLPSFVAGITAYQVSSALGMQHFYHPIEFVPNFSEAFFLKTVFAGICFGLVSLALIKVLQFAKRGGDYVKSELTRPLVGGVLLVTGALLFSKRYLGLGFETIEQVLGGENVPWYACFLKMIFTGVTLGFGGSGGIITPIFFVGATSGSVVGQALGYEAATFAAIGLVSVLAGAANTPISASIMAVELFGPQLAPYAAIACVISFIMTGHRSVYPSQVLSVRKSSSLDVDLGKEIDEANAKVKPRAGSLTELVLKAANWLRKRKD